MERVGERGGKGGREREKGGRERRERERREGETLTQVHTRQNLRPLRGKESKRRIGSMTRNSALGVPSHS